MRAAKGTTSTSNSSKVWIVCRPVPDSLETCFHLNKDVLPSCIMLPSCFQRYTRGKRGALCDIFKFLNSSETRLLLWRTFILCYVLLLCFQMLPNKDTVHFKIVCYCMNIWYYTEHYLYEYTQTNWINLPFCTIMKILLVVRSSYVVLDLRLNNILIFILPPK